MKLQSSAKMIFLSLPLEYSSPARSAQVPGPQRTTAERAHSGGASERKERSPLGLPAGDLQQLILQTGINTTSLIGLFSKTRLLCFNSQSLRKAGEADMQLLMSLSTARGPFPCSIGNVPMITLCSGVRLSLLN